MGMWVYAGVGVAGAGVSVGVFVSRSQNYWCPSVDGWESLRPIALA